MNHINIYIDVIDLLVIVLVVGYFLYRGVFDFKSLTWKRSIGMVFDLGTRLLWIMPALHLVDYGIELSVLYFFILSVTLILSILVVETIVNAVPFFTKLRQYAKYQANPNAIATSSEQAEI